MVVAASACAFRPNMGAAMNSEYLAKQPVGSDLDAEIAAAYREIAGDGLFRLSVGLEDAEDLIADLDAVL